MKELRIGLVLYGGVALAVYINGVVTEFWQALRASRSLRVTAPEHLDGTAAIYKSLLEELSASSDSVDLRIVVDAVAGTSAGGVNGAALFKAIVDGGNAAILNDTWLDDADIAKLKGMPDQPGSLIRVADWIVRRFPAVKRLQSKIHEESGLDWAWVRNTAYTAFTTKNGAQTPLNGDFFTGIIAASLRRMDKNRTGGSLLPSRGTFDLFLTRTDLHGWPRHLPVSRTYHEEDLYERTHAHVMAFRVRGGAEETGHAARHDVTDFDLTYGARTTAGFPLAFAPVTYAKVRKDFLDGYPDGDVRSAEEFTNKYLREHQLMGFPTERARMVDGGLLDNRPFTYVTRAIEDKPADHEVQRVVIYIEPDPEISNPTTKFGHPPVDDPLLKHVAPGLFRIFRHEPILGDLRVLQERNIAVERINAYRQAAEPDIENRIDAVIGDSDDDATPATIEEWRRKANQELVANPLSGYAGYVGLKLRGATDVYADLLCQALNLPYDSRHAFAVRNLVRMWMTQRPASGGQPDENVLDPLQSGDLNVLSDHQLRLLRAFDIPFRLRRARALVKIVNAGYADAENRQPLDEAKKLISDVIFKLENALDAPETDLGWLRTLTGIVTGGTIEDFLQALEEGRENLLSEYGQLLEENFNVTAQRLIPIAEGENQRLAAGIAELPEPIRTKVVRELVAFPYHDVMMFPLMDTAGVTDLITVDTLRISPYDAKLVGDRDKPLESAGFGAFRGFLKRRLREIDLLYGRLNGAERLVDIIVNSAAANGSTRTLEEIRERYKRKAMEVILDEAEAAEKSEIGPTVAELKEKLANS